MLKVFFIVFLAGLLVLAFSAPVLADETHSEKWFGEYHQLANWSWQSPPGDTPPGLRTDYPLFPGGPDAPYPGNPGQAISACVADIHDGDYEFLGISTWADFVTQDFWMNQ